MLRPGDRVVMRRNAIPAYPITEVVQVDDVAKKAQLRFSRPPGVQGYSYLFWRDLTDIQGGTDDGESSSET
jgi:hypothetical protein